MSSVVIMANVNDIHRLMSKRSLIPGDQNREQISGDFRFILISVNVRYGGIFNEYKDYVLLQLVLNFIPTGRLWHIGFPDHAIQGDSNHSIAHDHRDKYTFLRYINY